MADIIIHWGDGYITVDNFPDILQTKLRYYHRSLIFDDALRRRVAVGEYRELYKIDQNVENNIVSRKLTTLPGFMYKIKTLLRQEGHSFKVIDERTPAPKPNMEKAFEGLKDCQLECAYVTLMSGGGVVACPTGWGKCTGVNTPVIYSSGDIKLMGDVQVGDVLMGDDSTPRKVLERIDGRGPMYRITPKNGLPFEVADHHVLCLVKSGDCKRDKYPDGHIVLITVDDYLKASKTFKHRHKLYKVGVNFPAKNVRVDPYFLGLWLGDGNWNRPTITTSHIETSTYLHKHASTIGLCCTESPMRKNCNCTRFNTVSARPHSKESNTLLNAMRSYGLTKQKKKIIPRDFIINSRDVRLQLLAGLLDSDGHYDSGGKFDWCSVDEKMAKDMLFLVRSLGFRASYNATKVIGFGTTVIRHRVLISGNLDQIPTKVKKKQAPLRKQSKNTLRTGFTVERIEDGDYVGVKLNGNHRYLMGDFTVLHNTHIIASIINAYDPSELKIRNTQLTVVATPEKDITQKDFDDLTKLLPDREVGLVMSGKKKFSDDVQVITLDSLHLLPPDEIGILLIDEVHTAVSPRRSDTITAIRKALKWGVSATPVGRFDGRDLVTEGLFGPVVYQRTYSQGIEDGMLVPITVYWVHAPEPEMGIDKYSKYKTRAGRYRNGVFTNKKRNQLTIDILRRTPDTEQMLCIMPHLLQMDRLMELCNGNLRTVHAEESQEALVKKRCNNLAPVKRKERRQVYKDMASGKIRKILSTYVYKQGVNFPELSVVINAGGGGSDIVTKQIPGRESRNIEGKDVSYMVDFWHDWDTVVDKRNRPKPGSVHVDDIKRERAYNDLGFKQIWVRSIDELPFVSSNNE